MYENQLVSALFYASWNTNNELYERVISDNDLIMKIGQDAAKRKFFYQHCMVRIIVGTLPEVGWGNARLRASRRC
jgi:hypothetical protein